MSSATNGMGLLLIKRRRWASILTSTVRVNMAIRGANGKDAANNCRGQNVNSKREDSVHHYRGLPLSSHTTPLSRCTRTW